MGQDPFTMIRNITLSMLCSVAIATQAQTSFYISGITVDPSAPTTLDEISIALSGDLASTGAYVSSVSASVTGTTVTIAITAVDDVGGTVLVPHTENIPVGFLAAGDYTIVIDGTYVDDLADQEDHHFTVVGGSGCEDLHLLSVQWAPFSDTAVMVHASNMNMVGELFDYPNFILFDASGDTIAKETVNFFGIGQDSWHTLRIQNGATPPSGPFNGRLELWKSFTTELACSWDSTFMLCPPEPCINLLPTMQNFGGALVIGTFGWTLFNAEQEQVASGSITMTANEQYGTDTVCVPPGDYALTMVPDQEPSGGAPYFGVTIEGQFIGPAVPLELPVAPPLEFAFYAPCADGLNGIEDRTLDDPYEIRVMQGMVQVQRRDGLGVGPLELIDAQGRVLFQHTVAGSSAFLPTHAFAPGLMVLRLVGASRKLLVP